MRTLPLLLTVSLMASVGMADVGPTTRTTASGSMQIFYTYHNQKVGGIGAVTIDRHTGKILSQQSIAASGDFCAPHKLAVSECGRYVGASSQHEFCSNFFLVDLQQKEATLLDLVKKPDAVEAYGSKFVVGADIGVHYMVDGPSASLDKSWNGRQALHPSGRRIEYISVASHDNMAWTSWQKDSGSGRHKGSRVVAFDLASWTPVADVKMPRARPDLHLASFSEQGPSPEIIIPSYRTNTLLLSMDLYGGIAMADLDAVKRGAWRNLSYHTTALDESWGTGFPDRASVMTIGNKDYVLVTNAARGAVWVDLKARQVLQRIDVPPGLETPAILPASGMFVAAALGKLKYRSFGDLRETRAPTPELFVFQVEGRTPTLALKRHQLPVQAYRALPVAPDSNDLVFLTVGEGHAKEVMVVRASTGEVIDRQPALGRIYRIAGL